MSNLHVLATYIRQPSEPVQNEEDLRAAVDRTLSLISAIDMRFDQEQAAIEATMHPRPWKDWRLDQLAVRHSRERQPLVYLLCMLYQRQSSNEPAQRR